MEKHADRLVAPSDLLQHCKVLLQAQAHAAVLGGKGKAEHIVFLTDLPHLRRINITFFHFRGKGFHIVFNYMADLHPQFVQFFLTDPLVV